MNISLFTLSFVLSLSLHDFRSYACRLPVGYSDMLPGEI